MKKITKIITSMIMAVVMIMALGIGTNAAGPYTITITGKPAVDKGTHTYTAYRVFKGDLQGTGDDAALQNIDWAEGVDGVNLLTALKADPDVGATFTSCTTAEEVAQKLVDGGKTLAEKFADIAAKNLGTSAGSGSGTISVSEAGYYLVIDSASGEKPYALSDHLLKIVDNVTISVKEDLPSMDKKIIEGGSEVEANTASIGDKVNYQIKTNVPDMTGYNKYYFVVDDTLDTGLTFNNDVTITMGGTTLAASSYDVEVTGNKFSIVFKNFISYQSRKGEEILIKYSATLNEQAKIGTSVGNANTAKLTFSNDPNNTDDGITGDKPGPGSPVGETPEYVTKTYTTKLRVVKQDVNNPGTKLSKAKFEISGTGLGITLINGDIFKESATGTYWMRKDGTFSTTEPAAADKGSDKKYEKVSVVTKDTEKTFINKSAYTNASGIIEFTGLNAGEYNLTELEAPEDYNLLSAPVDVKITRTISGSSCTFTTTSSNATVESDGTVVITIGNAKGYKLPGTGGIGTTVFYVVGGLLVISAAVLFVTKKRIGSVEK